MSVNKEYLEYPYRRPGMDHDRYARDNVFTRKRIKWPNDARVALWIMPLVEYFPLDMPLNAVPGGMTRPYPDYWNYTLREYGNRVGIFRIIRALDEREIRASAAFNSRAARRYPFLLDQVLRRDWEVVAMGVDMGKIHQGGIDREREAQWIGESLATLRELSGQPVKGWVSPGLSESFHTPDHVADEDVVYICDWMNDDLPYFFKVMRQGKEDFIVAMPHGHEISDLKLMADYGHTPKQYSEQVIDYFELIYREAENYGGRILSLPLHAWLMGTPSRIGSLEMILDHIFSREGVWIATGHEILACWRDQTERPK
ncbi:polysaccharide deacetylase [Thermodesulfobacteriota bacterium]